MRDRAGSVFHRDAVSRTAERASHACQSQDPRDRRAQGVARSRERRRLHRGTGCRVSSPNGCEKFFTLRPERLPDLAEPAREHRLRAAQRHSRCAVYQARSGHLPESADLLPAAGAEDGSHAVSLRAEAGRLSVPRIEREPGRRWSTSSTRSTSMARFTARNATSACRAISSCRCRAPACALQDAGHERPAAAPRSARSSSPPTTGCSIGSCRRASSWTNTASCSTPTAASRRCSR